MQRSQSHVVRTLVMCALSAPGVGQGAQFVPLGDLPGGLFNSAATSVSGDGRVVVGVSTASAGQEAFRWTASTGMVSLGDLPGGTHRSIARATNFDGSVVVGSGNGVSTIPGNWQDEAVRWTASTGLVSIAPQPASGFWSSAEGVSDDGSVLVGFRFTTPPPFEPFRWTASTGVQGLGSLPGSSEGGGARAVSGDGQVIVGTANPQMSPRVPAYWTASQGLRVLGDLPGGSRFGEALAANFDGSVIVGFAGGARGREAFRWTPSGGMTGLGFLRPSDSWSEATDVNRDGSVVVGFSFNSSSGYHPFVWTPSRGMRSLHAELVAQGASGLAGWQLAASSVSADGRVIAGTGLNPSMNYEAFVAILP